MNDEQRRTRPENGSHVVRENIQYYKRGLGEFEEKMPELVRAYNDFTGICFRDGALDKKTKQLVALGIGLGMQDEYCIMYHTQEALHTGASEQEIMEVIGVAAAFSGGAAMSQGVTLVQECLDQLPRKNH